MKSQDDVNLLLEGMVRGNTLAADRLFSIVYPELHRLATACMLRERPDHTLQPTALINEVFMRLTADSISIASKEHFVALAATAMRRILVDHARKRMAGIRWGGQDKIQLDEALVMAQQSPRDIVALNDALEQLHQTNPRQAKVVELRFFAGLSVEEIAAILHIATRSVKRDWALARIWLHGEIAKR